MKRCVLAAAAALACSFAIVSTASAQTAVLSYDDGNGTPNAGTYFPGQSFTFSIELAFSPGGSVTNLIGTSYWFEQAIPIAPFYFSITNRDFTGSPFTDPQTIGITYPQSLNPSNPNDLGALISGNGSPVGAGTYFIANLTVTIDPAAAPGTYFIEDTTRGGKTSVISDSNGDTAPISEAVYTITIIPEPSSLVLLAAGMSILVGIVFLRRPGTR